MRRFAVLLVAMLAAACGSDATSAPVVPNVVGTWTLETIDSKALPVVLQQAGEDKIELLESGLIATNDGSFTATTTQRTTISGAVSSESYTDLGNYSMKGPVVTLTFSADGFVVMGTIVGDQLVFTNGNMPLIYRRK